MIKAGVFGATGYTGYELVKVLQRHPQVEITFATSQSFAGQTLAAVYPQAPQLPLILGEEAPLDGVDVVFLCLPHAAAAETAVRALKAGVTVIDLSADFRLKGADTYAAWYDKVHPAPHLLADAVYGLTEFARDQLRGAKLVATPGCYPTSILLPLRPLLTSPLPITDPIIADAKSGTSGAGRTPKAGTHFIQVHNNFAPYKIGRSHRHLPEIEQVMGWFCPEAPTLIFSPHLLPVERGILSTIYVNFSEAVALDEVRPYFTKLYANEPFVCLLPEGELATLAHVAHSNKCVIGLTMAGNTLVITSAIDNLVKGAAGQAVQNMNAVFGIEETAGLI
ncbi:N-acetyl-gamma-glutamyl-phosphate reductase [Candidatus Leptofilum sp.]|uniref:N-acetyl-gamma-glutamyl-phosphate reductase n=1 Tax=Candidatus Leptofilum sp. TaxID=3241576 RepID=UPI003B5C5E35